MKIALHFAMYAEAEPILADKPVKETISGVPVYELQDNILAYIGGIGKVDAAMAAQLIIDHCNPDWIINIGVAGCLKDIPTGSLVLVDKLFQHDMDTTPLGDPKGLLSSLGVTELVTTSIETIKKLLTSLGTDYFVGSCATGDQFMVDNEKTQELIKDFSPTLCEMEAGAIAQVCSRNKKNFTSIKMVSDHPLKPNSTEEYNTFLTKVVTLARLGLALAQAMIKLEDQWKQSLLSKWTTTS